MALFGSDSEKNARHTDSGKTGASAIPAAVNLSSAEPGQAQVRAARPAVAQAAYLDRGCKVSGKLNFEGPVRIDGAVDGEISAKDAVTIGETAVVKAQVKASSIIVSGVVTGEMKAAQRIEIRASAKVSGNISAPKLVVEEGAVFEGNCSMQAEPETQGRELHLLSVVPNDGYNGAPQELEQA